MALVCNTDPTNNSLQSSIFFLKRKMQHNPCGKCCAGNVIYNEKGGKTKNAEINNVVYMELYWEQRR
jgi:hypothetical protein